MSRLLLLGAGPAQLFVLEALARGKFPACDATLVARNPRRFFPGMLPGLVEGRYRAADLIVDLPALARRAGARFIQSGIARLDAADRAAHLRDGTILQYDVASVAIGGRPSGLATPGAAMHARFLQPAEGAEALPEVLDRLAEEIRPDARRVLVVGAGTQAIELALCIRGRLDRRGATDLVVTLVSASAELFRGQLPEQADRVEALLRGRDIALRLGLTVSEVGPDFVRMSDGRVQPVDLVIWATGMEAPTLFRDSGLPTDRRGSLLVEETLAVSGAAGIFGAGAAVSLAAGPEVPRSTTATLGMGPVLVENLAAVLRGDRVLPRRYRPRLRAPALLNTGDGRALLLYGPVTLHAGWAMRLKDRVDRRRVARFADSRSAGTGADRPA